MQDTSFDRRTVLRAAAGAVAVAGIGRATAGDAPRKLVVPDVEFFERGVVGQYVLVTDPTGGPAEPPNLPDCPFVDWPSERTRHYEGLLLDRLTDRPHATRVPVYADGATAGVTVGTPYLVAARERCGSYLGLHVEPVGATDETEAEAEESTGNATGGNRTGRNRTDGNASTGIDGVASDGPG